MIKDLNQCSKKCLSCIREYKNKHSLKVGQRFNIKCNGIPKDHVPISILESINPEEREMAKSLLDPVAWAAQTLDWHCLDTDGSIWKRKNPDEYQDWVNNNPGVEILGHSRYHRPYQATTLRCTAKRKVLRWGRQLGKCLASGTLIQMADGTQKSVEEVQDGDLVVSIDDNYRSVINKAYRACNGIKPVYLVTLVDGRIIEATEHHPFLSRRNIGRKTTGKRGAIFEDKWVEVKDLTEKHYLAVPSRISIEKRCSTYWMPSNYKDRPDLVILGCIIADGNITSDNCRFSNTNDIILSTLSDSLNIWGCKLVHYPSDNYCDFHIIGSGPGKPNKVRDFFRKYNLWGLNSHNKYIPDEYMKAPNEDIALLLSSMFGCDGWASVSKKDKVEIGYSTTSEKLAQQIIALLARFNIYASCNNKIVKLNDKKYVSKQITISRKQSIVNFRNYIGILGKRESLEKVYKASQNKNSSPKTEVYEENDLTFIKVKSVEYVGEKMTWDLTVPETHNFIANNIVTHNTEGLVIYVLFHLFTKPSVPDTEGFKIVLITPYQSQIDLIFSRLNELISTSSITKNSLRRYVKAPMYTMELYNGSIIKGFSCVAGTKITTKRGLINIEDVTDQDFVLSKNKEDSLEWMAVSHVYEPNYKDVYKVTLFSGHEVVVSEDHPFWTKDKEWKKLKDLNINDKVAIANDFKMGKGDPDPLGYLLGLILGDGSITYKTMKDGGPRFTSNNPTIQKNFEDTLDTLNIAWRDQIHGKTGSKEYTVYKREKNPKIKPQNRPYTALTKLLLDYNLIGCTSKTKNIPDDLFNRSPEFRAGLLKGLLETDGYLQSNGTAGFSSISKDLAFGVRNLLNSFGIKASIKKKKQAGKKIKINTEQRYICCNYDLYEVIVRSKLHTKLLLETIDLSAKANYQKCLDNTNTKVDTYNEIDFFKIRSIEYVGKDTTYDIAVGDGTNNFIANGILLHNTAGTKSGGNAESVRGQHAHMLVFDEADYLCLSKNSIVEKNDGSLIKIEDLVSGEKIHSYNNKSIVSEVSQIIPSLNSYLTKIHTSYSEIESTSDHRHFILGKNGIEEKVTHELTTDDFVILPKNGIIGDRKIDIKWCELAGYFWGDGNKNADYYKNNKYWNTINFTDKDINNLEFYKNIALDLGFSNSGSIIKSKNSEAFKLTLSEKAFVQNFIKYFNSLYFSKKITSEISTLNHQSLCGFLRGAFDAEGSVNLKRKSVVISQGNKQSIQIIRLLLHKIGILCSLSKHHPSGFGKNPVYQLSIADDRFVFMFSEYIGFNSVAKKEKLSQCISKRKFIKNNYSNLRYPASYCLSTFQFIRDEVKQKFIGKQIIFDSLNRGINPTLNSLESLSDGLKSIGNISLSKKVENLYSNFYASKINLLEKKYDSSGFDVVDISVPETESFFANGMLTHNCTGDMDAAMAIITNHPTAVVWMSSTPQGKREMFYENCNSRRYKEFHFPSSCNPLWSEDLEADFREALTDIGYVHEVEASFGEQEQGVFQHAYIQSAKADYRYEDITPHRSWTYALGVDWNDTKIGTTINILGFDPSKTLYYVVNRIVVSREGWTQLAACQKIAELNRIWRPIAIYVDRGFGGTQVEILKKYGYDSLSDPTKGPTHPDSALRDIVKPYDFGCSMEVRDLFTKQPIKKNAKGFLVESTVRRFEANDIRFSEYDEGLEAQLSNYIIDRVTPTGNPVYKANNEGIGDHALDALMLSVIAFILEISPLGKPKYSTQIEFTGKIGENIDVDTTGMSLVIKSDKRKTIKEQRDSTKPEARDISKQDSIFENANQLPANHTYHNTPKLWAWPGFGSDSPKPQVRSLRQAADVAKKRIGLSPRRGSRPSRKNI